MKTVIVYASIHHQNTEKLVKGVAKEIEVKLIDITKNKSIDLSEYDRIGFASGVFYQSMHKNILNCIERTKFREGQKVFLIATCGVIIRDYTKPAKKILAKKNIEVLGSYQCRGFDTFGLFAKIGGIAKKHPNDNDIRKAQKFVKSL